MIGRTLSHYKIVEKIGAGGMGEVYLAEDSELGRHVALKVLPAELASSEERRARFKREAKAIAALNHPNIVTLHSVEEAEGVHFLTMELVRGKRLTELLAGEPLGLDRFFEIAVPLADALASAHTHGITHRDLKPDNVMLNEEGRVKVLDFGLAKLRIDSPSDGASELPTGTMTQEGHIVGTVSHMSPEQAEGKRVDYRTDIFSLGIVLYEMATGKRPFQGDSPVSVLSAILKETPTPVLELNAALPEELERIIQRCLQKDRELRYPLASELKRDLEEIRREVESGSRPRRRRRSLVPWIAGAAAALAIAIAGLLLPRASREGETSRLSTLELSLAVLPFQNLSADPENDYFSDGMTEELIGKLSRIRDLRVPSRSSVSRFKGSERDVSEIATELGVGFVLEGSVRRAGERVRVSAQLTDTSTGFLLWTDTYDAELQDVFAVQEETAMRIVEALDLTLTPQEQQEVERRYTDSAEAYDAYLRGNTLMQSSTMDLTKIETARKYFEQALEHDPSFALAMVGLVRVEQSMYRTFDPSETRVTRIEELVGRALTLDPKLAPAYVALGGLHAVRYDYHEAAEAYREAIRLDPNDPEAWDYLSWVLAYQEPPDADGAEEAAREAIRLQPSFTLSYYHLGRALLLQERYPEAIAAFDYVEELSPESQLGRFGRATVYLKRGEYERGLIELEEVRRVPAMLVQLKSALHAGLGQREKALSNLEEAVAGGYRDCSFLESSHYFLPLRDEPRFQRVLDLCRN